jgi:ABC-type transport system involved in multi-copper enzyme maturation permease subunit
MMNIFVRELRANLKSLLIWSAIVTFLIFMAVTKYSAFAGDPELLKMMDSMPKALLDAFAMSAFNMTTLSGFYGIMFIYFGLMGAIAAAMWGSDIISKEERDKTVEFSLVLPVSTAASSRQGVGGAGQLHPIRADHLGRVAGVGARTLRPGFPTSCAQMQAPLID